jgi:hypothetical protein
MKSSLIFISLLAAPIIISAQTADDAYRFSQTHVTGTSRNQALGGAMGALGVDVSNAAGNPAGLGIATKGEFYFTPALLLNSTKSRYLDNIEYADRYKLGMNGLGLNLVSGSYKKGNDYRRIGLAFSFNNVARFSENRLLSADNNGNVYVDIIANNLNRQPFSLTSLDNFKDRLFFNTYALDTVNIKDTAVLQAVGNFISNFGSGRTIRQTIEERVGGYMNSFDISLFGTPYNDKVYIGASLGIPSIRYNEEFILIDEDPNVLAGNSYSAPLKSYQYNIDRNVQGSGINLKVGVIVRATDFLRIGGYIHTPTAYTLSETYSTSLTSKFYSSSPNGETINDKPEGNSVNTYSLVTPFRAGLNFGFVISKFAAIGIDYETIGYNQATLGENGSNGFAAYYKNENKIIKAKLERADNIRAGLEINIKPVKLRAGYNLRGSGLIEDKGVDKYAQQISGGIGFTSGKWYFDGAYSRMIRNYNYIAYSGAATAAMNRTTALTSVTVGVKF